MGNRWTNSLVLYLSHMFLEIFRFNKQFVTQVVFAATVTTEIVTGNSVFRKMDIQGIEETIGVYVGAMISAAIFAWLSSARNRVGKIFTVSCNAFIDSLIDQIVDGLFYESELSDWSDDI